MAEPTPEQKAIFKKLAAFKEKLDDYQCTMFDADIGSLEWWARFDASRKALVEAATQIATK